MFVAAALLFATPADLLVINAKIWTDGALSQNTVLAVRNEKVTYVGKSAKGLRGPKTRVVDAKGRIVTPGIIDAHTHLARAGVGFKYGLDLRVANSKEQFIELVRKKVATLPAGAWLSGRGWSTESYKVKETPHRDWIDSVTGDRPAVLTRMDGHSLLANSAALKLAGITKDGPADPPGGSIERDPKTGEPTGILVDAAMPLIQTPPPSRLQLREGLKAVVAEANRFGVTAVGDIMDPLALSTVREYAANPDRSIRFGVYLQSELPMVVGMATEAKPIPGWFEPRGIKLYMDGSLGSRSAYMAAPFTKPLPTQPADWRGLPRIGATNGLYAQLIKSAADANLQVITHAIGDQANKDALDLYAKVPELARRRFRIEHAQHLLPSEIGRFAKLGVLPSMQPFHKADDGRYCDDVIGKDRSRSSYTFKTFLKSGAKLTFGSDFPVVTIDPWIGIHTAVTGEILGSSIWMPEQNISFDQALDAYTRTSAYAIFREKDLGRLVPGYQADFVILEGSPYRKNGTKNLRPAATYVAGQKVF